MSGRRPNCCPIAFRLISWIHCPLWSVFIHRLRKLITAVEGHYQFLGFAPKIELYDRTTIPALPACRVEAATRDDAIRLAREAIAQLVRRSEVVQVEIPEQPRATASPQETPWAWFGTASEDPTWAALFEAIEESREATRDAE